MDGTFFSTTLSVPEIAIRLLLAAGCTAVIGIEREWQEKAAGLRTHMLVGIGAAAFYILGIEIIYAGHTSLEKVSVDPTRLIQGIIGGIGFLGAGAILQSDQKVKGLTTAAGIWVSGAIGLACGSGFYAIALILSVFCLVILVVIGRLQHQAMKMKDGKADQ